jgi:hypothetical protein
VILVGSFGVGCCLVYIEWFMSLSLLSAICINGVASTLYAASLSPIAFAVLL